MRAIRNVAFVFLCASVMTVSGPVADASSLELWEEECDQGNDCSFSQESQCEWECQQCFEGGTQNECEGHEGVFTFSDLECFGDPCFATCVCYYNPIG